MEIRKSEKRIKKEKNKKNRKHIQKYITHKRKIHISIYSNYIYFDVLIACGTSHAQWICQRNIINNTTTTKNNGYSDHSGENKRIIKRKHRKRDRSKVISGVGFLLLPIEKVDRE